jgi:hypothetical protein
MKRLVGWLKDALSLGLPLVLWGSATLPGVPGGANAADEDWIQEDLAEALVRARRALREGKLRRARAALEEADSLSAKLRPHTPSFERLCAKKTKLWDDYKRMKR